jgi:hypothetical protein
MYKPMLGGSSKIWVIIDDSSSNYTYPTLTLTFIQIPELKHYPWTYPYIGSRFNLGIG